MKTSWLFQNYGKLWYKNANEFFKFSFNTQSNSLFIGSQIVGKFFNTDYVETTYGQIHRFSKRQILDEYKDKIAFKLAGNLIFNRQ